MLCREVMKADVARCAENLSVQACAEIMRDDNIGFLPVVDAEKQVVGVITDRDLAVRVLADDLPGDTPVGQVMTRVVRICRPDDELLAAERKMATSRAGGVLRAVTRREAPE